ncbi:hypothetical protein RQP53_19145 [Paucibacter sp. APW11]|uniref:SPOR domain-containing protein n=1 Tax=Roseateles aquae TaxID=3077235 RepID=A0ABU3PFN4_9BURK|nr:hypothetical protein [Paucibacter sp. APW11]MDT9001405.1 hypothetical protein [Paucibacter sp. APW11]
MQTDDSATAPPLLTAQVTPHDHMLLNRIAQQLAAWHNRHPLARRIKPADVHTIGVIALPYMRAGRPEMPVEPPVEPAVDLVDDPAHSEAAAAFEAMAADADHPAHFTEARPSLPQRLLAALRALLPGGKKTNKSQWPAFSEQFLVGLSARDVARFADRYGYRQQPGSGKLPQRQIAVDDSLAAGDGSVAGAWPCEVYLLSAAIEAGPAKSRVLLAEGAGQKLHFIGPRCLHPLRLGMAAFAVALGLGVAAVLLTQPSQRRAPIATPTAPTVATAASAAASAVLPAASAPPMAASSPPEPASAVASAVEAASAPSNGASVAVPVPITATATPAPAPVASAATPPVAAAPAASMVKPGVPASALPPNDPNAPDIRPHLGPGRPRMAEAAGKSSGKGEDNATDKPATKAVDKPSARSAERGAERKPAATDEKSSEKASERASTKSTEPARRDAVKALEGKPAGKAAAADEGRQVALVAQPVPSRAEAESLLLRMRTTVGATLRDSSSLQAQVFETPEGWRAAVWPFASREEAQLINATLIARGLRTKAVDF